MIKILILNFYFFFSTFFLEFRFLDLKFSPSYGQEMVTISRLISGPVQGYTTSSSLKIWLLAKYAKNITVNLAGGGKVHTLTASTDSCSAYGEFSPVTFTFENLQPETKYEILVKLDNHEVRDKKMITAKTLSEEKLHDFSFLLGSCAFMPSKFIQPFYPGKMDRIFTKMRKTPADFMLWLGDNLYYRPRHYGSAKGMYKQQILTRKKNRIDHFMKSMPQYAIWDDHDYGSNDSDGSFPLKDSSLSIHKKFWPNPFFGTPDIPGTFSNFKMYDCEFFLLDNRFYRTPPNDKDPTVLGNKQLDWFLENLKKSDAAFKFVAVGTQMLNESTPHECYSQFPSERAKIFKFINENKISGVIFLTGDIHHTVLMKSENLCNYPIYDFTCSPLTSVVHNIHSDEFYNSLVVKDKTAVTYNYGKISISGKEGSRHCMIEVYNSGGDKLWDYTIEQGELYCR